MDISGLQVSGVPEIFFGSAWNLPRTTASTVGSEKSLVAELCSDESWEFSIGQIPSSDQCSIFNSHPSRTKMDRPDHSLLKFANQIGRNQMFKKTIYVMVCLLLV